MRLSYATGWSIGLWFFVMNLPVYVLAWIQMSPRITLHSFIAVGFPAAISEGQPHLFIIERVDPILGAVIAGALIGIGLIVLFRHGVSLGGIGVLAQLL